MVTFLVTTETEIVSEKNSSFADLYYFDAFLLLPFSKFSSDHYCNLLQYKEVGIHFVCKGSSGMTDIFLRRQEFRKDDISQAVWSGYCSILSSLRTRKQPGLRGNLKIQSRLYEGLLDKKVGVFPTCKR